MLKKAIVITSILLGFMTKVYSQELGNFQATNEVYQKFKQAFDSLDHELFAEIHSENLIRIPGGKGIVDYDSYMEKQKNQFEKAKKENSTRSIELRFIERVNDGSIASDRGIYKFFRNENQPDEKISYGKFHVIMINENGDWKILMDYDSNEGMTIDEDDFNKAFDMTDFEKFMKQ